MLGLSGEAAELFSCWNELFLELRSGETLSLSSETLLSYILSCLISWSFTFTRFTKIYCCSVLKFPSLPGVPCRASVGESMAFSLASRDCSRTSCAVNCPFFTGLPLICLVAEGWERESLNLSYLKSSSLILFSVLSSYISILFNFIYF